jgi:hypothetical protein
MWAADKERIYAETQLAHVREQMGSVLTPMPTLLHVSIGHKMCLDIELGLPCGRQLSEAAGGPARPLVLSPEADMYKMTGGNPGSLRFFMQSAITKYGAADLVRDLKTLAEINIK